MPVDALNANVGVVLLEFEVHGLEEVDVGTLDGVHIFASHLKLVEIKVFWENLHLNNYYDNNFIQVNYNLHFLLL